MNDLFHLKVGGHLWCQHHDFEDHYRGMIVCTYRWRVAADEKANVLRKRYGKDAVVVVPGNCPGEDR